MLATATTRPPLTHITPAAATNTVATNKENEVMLKPRRSRERESVP